MEALVEKSPYKTNSDKGGDFIGGIQRNNAGKQYDDLKYPSSIQEFNNRSCRQQRHAPYPKTRSFNGILDKNIYR